MNGKLLFVTIALLIVGSTSFFYTINRSQLPIVAIASYGPHPSLSATIDGFEKQMQTAGFIQGENIDYVIADVGFDFALIPQMLSSLKIRKPKLMVVISTPVAQVAKAKVHDIPLIYAAVTDPVEAGLIKEKYKADGNMIGSSEMQDLNIFLQFVKEILPGCKRIGMLYSVSESNDTALLRMLNAAASKSGMKVMAVPVEQARDVAVRVRQFKDAVDLIYVGTSGPIQPSLPTIVAAAREMHIPVFNADVDAVREGLALAGFGVDYVMVGKNAGKLAAEILNGKDVMQLSPIYPSAEDHHEVINKRIAEEFGANILPNVEIVE